MVVVCSVSRAELLPLENKYFRAKKGGGGQGGKGSNWGLSKGDFAYHCKCHDLSGATVRHNERRD